MSVSFYEISIGSALKMLKNLSAMLDKAEQHASAKKFDSAVLVSARLFPDMLPLSSQVQIACDVAKGAVGRLTGIDPPKFEDTERTIADLKARVAKTVDFIKSVDRGKFDGAESRAVTMKLPTRELQFTGLSYVTDFVIPNVLFHAATTYGLLRHNGVELGKADFLGAI